LTWGRSAPSWRSSTTFLAEQSRRLLPDVVERGRQRYPVPWVVEPALVAPPEPSTGAIESAAPAALPPVADLVLAVLNFVAGAISGTLLGGRDSAPVG
jgi:hypothetical protein